MAGTSRGWRETSKIKVFEQRWSGPHRSGLHRLSADIADYKLFEPAAAHLLCGTDMLSAETVSYRFE